MQALAKQAVKIMNGFRQNAIIMAFVNNEAREKTAEDIRNKTGSGTTAKAVALLLASGNDESIADRFEGYVNLGLFACYMASIEAASK